MDRKLGKTYVLGDRVKVGTLTAAQLVEKFKWNTTEEDRIDILMEFFRQYPKESEQAIAKWCSE